MMNRLVALTVLAAIALPSFAEAGALCGSKRSAGYAAPRYETNIRVARAPEAFRPVRDERVAPRAPVKAAPVRVVRVDVDAPDADPSQAVDVNVAIVSQSAAAAIPAGAQAEARR
jgi:hypothetical protein